MAGITRLFFNGDHLLDLRKPDQVELLATFLAKWRQAQVEVIVLTRGKVEAKLMELQAVDIRKHLEDVLSLEDPHNFPAVGDLLLQNLRKEGWVPREQILVDTSIPELKSIWLDGKGEPRRYTLAHTLRLPENSGKLDERTLESIDQRIFMTPAKLTTHCSLFDMDGDYVVDPVDNLEKFKLDGMMMRERKESLEAMSPDKQMECLRGRPDLAELLGVPPVEVEEDAPAQPAINVPASRNRADSNMGKTKSNISTSSRKQSNFSAYDATSSRKQSNFSAYDGTANRKQSNAGNMDPMQNRGYRAQPPSTPKSPTSQNSARRRLSSGFMTGVSEGQLVKVGDGPHAGALGIVRKVVREGMNERYRVELQSDGSSTWTSGVKSADGRGSNASQTVNYSNVVSPLMAALSGGSPVSGKSGGKGVPPSRKSAASQPPDEFPEGTEVEVLAGKEQGRCGTVMKILGEGADKKYRVQMEAGGGAVWVPSVKKATRPLLQEEVKTKITDLYDVVKKKLGTGAFGSVTKVTSKSTNLVRAMKSCPKPMVKNVDVIWKEVAIMRRLDHPNIIKIYDTFEDHRNIYLIMELCTGGELFDRIVASGHFTEQQSASVMQQALRAVFYMHSKMIVHRDLKPENFLLATDGPVEKALLKVIDFGLAHDFPAPGEYLHTRTGSAYYVAPQVLEGKYDEAADMWSFGVIMFVMLCGHPPFDGETDPEIFAKVKAGEFEFKPDEWSDVSKDAQDMITELLRFDPAVRMKAGEALKHTWVSKKAPGASTTRRGSVIDNLRGFQSQSKLKKAALQLIANQMSEEQIKSLRETFVALDLNGDGLLTTSEMRDGISKLGLQEVPEDLKQIMEHVDANASGSIDYTEFLSASLDAKTYLREEYCWAAFRIFDKNGDGKISKQEMSEVLKDTGLVAMAPSQGDVEALLTDCDADGDGEVDFQEFMAMMRKS